MKSISEWIETGKSLNEEDDFPLDNSYAVAVTRVNIDNSEDILHNVTCIADYHSRVPKVFHYAMLQWNKFLNASKSDKSLNLKELKTSTLGVISAAWYVLFSAYRGWGAEYAAKKGKSFISDLGKEITMLSKAWVDVKAGKMVKP